jgi:integrase
MSSIRVRSDRLQLDFRYRGVRCREQTALTDTKVNRAKLHALLKEIDSAIRLKKFVYSNYFPGSRKCKQFADYDKAVNTETIDQSPTTTFVNTPRFSEFCAEWLAENDVSWKVSYIKNLNIILNNYLLPEFGEFYIEEITRPMLLKFRASVAKRHRGIKRVGNDWINHVMTPLRQIMIEAANRYQFSNPFIDIKPLKIEQPLINPFTLNEVKIFLAGVRSDFRNYYTVRLFTGMRTGEIDGLQWQFVDIENKQILIQKTIVDGYEETPKTQSSYRAIHLSQPVISALKKQLNITGKSTYVFCNSEGNPFDHRNITKRIWHPTLKMLGFSKRRPYETRHTCATLWLASGENPEWIARQLGHSSTKMLFERYSRYVPNITRQDGSAFESLINGLE